MKTMTKYQKKGEVKGSKGANASQIIAGITSAVTGAAGIGKTILDNIKAKKIAKEKAKMEAEGKMQYGGPKKQTKEKRPVPKPFPKSGRRPITINEKYGILGTYGPKTEADTNTLNFINNAGKTPIPGKQKGGVNKKMKTGGMVNSNAKVSASKVAKGSVGGISKALSKDVVKSASPKDKAGGVSKAPKKASPVKLAKAKMSGMKGKSC
jgi:hypothetical protein